MLSIILPTFNESQNLPELLKRIAETMGASDYEVIVVDDDSPDKTWEIAEKLRAQYPMLRVIRRIGRRGLSSAVVEGFDAAQGDVLLVMDSDLQHDPSLVLQLSDAVRDGVDIAVASRYMQGGSVGEWVGGRRMLSKTATWLTRKIPAVEVSDPMSGFFALSRSAYQRIRPSLHPTGFKILFEVLGHLPRGTKKKEIPLVFRMRLHGESKLSMRVQAEFLIQAVRLAFVRFQRWLFWIVCLIISFMLLARLIPILPLYTDASVRAKAQERLQALAADKGWLLSDVTLLLADDTYLSLQYRAHRKGEDPAPVCYRLDYSDPTVQEFSCDTSL